MTEGFANDFDAAARQTIAFLHQRLGFDLWMVTRTEGDDWIVLQAEDHGYGVAEGTVFRWADSFCSRMVAGLGPRIAPQSQKVPAYQAAPLGQELAIAAYVGVPLTRPDGELFGTLCGIHPASMPDSILEEQDLVELLASLLSSVLHSEIKAAEHARRVERAEAEAMNDGLTGLYNRRGWDNLLKAEEERCRRYKHPACVVSVDLDGLKAVNDSQGHSAGDALILGAATALRSVVRAQDIVARVGGDEFAIIGVECDRVGADRLQTRLRFALLAQGVKASVGLATRLPAEGLEHAWEQADIAMYADKRRAMR